MSAVRTVRVYESMGGRLSAMDGEVQHKAYGAQGRRPRQKKG